MAINNVKVILNNIDLQVDTNGVKPYSITTVDDSQAWLGRDKLLATRADDDSMAFEVQTLSGKRVLVSYTNAILPAVPQNNLAAKDSIYRRYLEYSYQINGQGMSQSDANSFYAIYYAHQALWAKRGQLIAQLQDPDIPLSGRNSLIAALNDVYNDMTTSAIALQMFGTTFNVLFAEGNSFQLTHWVIGEYADFTFNLVHRNLLT